MEEGQWMDADEYLNEHLILETENMFGSGRWM